MISIFQICKIRCSEVSERRRMKEKVLEIGKKYEVCAKNEILVKKNNDIEEILRHFTLLVHSISQILRV